jgi:hypothetical protein
MATQIRNHKWNKEDSVLTLYYVKFGLRRLPVKDEKEFAEWIIGSTVTSLVMQSANIRFLLGFEDGTLTDFSAVQKEAVEQYNNVEEEVLREIVIAIIDKRDVKQNIANSKAKKVEKQKKVWKSESDKQLEDALRAMGKDPSKMKKVVRVK